MTSINLLPWRESYLKIENNKFMLLAGVSIGICVAVMLLINLYFARIVSLEKSESQKLKNEIRRLDSKIKKIKGLEEQRELLLERADVIHALQDIRPFTVRLFDNLVRAVPNGVIFNKIEKKGMVLIVAGKSSTNAKISNFMRNLQDLEWVESAKLSEILSGNDSSNYLKKDDEADQEIIEFTVELIISHEKGVIL